MPIGAFSIGTANHHKNHCASPLSVPGSGGQLVKKTTQIPSAVFIDGTHIKASANKKKFQKEQVAKAAKVYSGQLRREVNAEREKLGKEPIEDENDNEKDPSQGVRGHGCRI